jgi:peptidoglycan/xylan/chitin deacetylase (PgdA/CDA1 family)
VLILVARAERPTAVPVTRLRAAVRALAAFALSWFARLGGNRAGVVIVYHRVGGSAGDPRLEILPAVSTEEFDKQLHHIRRRYRVVPASEIVDATARRRRGGRFPVAITFDDDLRCHVDDALPALRRAGVTATFFLTGTSLVSRHAFWWEDLQHAVDDRLIAADALPGIAESDLRAALGREPRAIFRVAEAIEKLDRSSRDRVATLLRATVGTPAEPGLRSADVRKLVEGGCDIGFHTRGHDALPGLSDADLTRAFVEGRTDVETAAGAPLGTIAYPHGRADNRVADAARRAGFAIGFTTRRETVSPDADALLVPRIVPALSADRMRMRLARALTR